VRLIAVKSFMEFWAHHPELEQPLEALNEETKVATWSDLAELKLAFRPNG
jgi:mRNA-degrading endonuclease HigB of HigAB toxin-antitoxin module